MVIDTIEFVRGILEIEVNSTLDNPVCHYCYPARTTCMYLMCGYVSLTDCTG